ncbi:fungal-specific transcription factor domain-containing protein [Trametes polyzona]|nr:fungal-specific transcription factor domain-containing protein [Trametes polyzona]
MSSQEEDDSAGVQPGGTSKRRKVLQRACDYCRRKKIKCDGPKMPNKRCSKCISRRAECTYVEPFHKQRYPDSYVENLESRLQRMEDLLNKLNLDADVMKTLGDVNHDSPKPASENAPSPSSASTSSLRVPHIAISPSSPEAAVAEEEEYSDHDEAVRQQVKSGMSTLSLQPLSFRYHGKSSGWVFIQTTEGFRQEYLRETVSKGSPSDSKFLHSPPHIKYRRQPWLEHPLQERAFSPEEFPPPDLMNDLIQLYFRHLNDYQPFLHEPTFLQNIRDKMHLRIAGFGATVLLVCAIGARHSRDRRVVLDRTDMWESAGWQWYQKADEMHKSLIAPVHLYDLQICALSIIYMHTTIMPHTSWITAGVGLRKAIDVGAHRKTMYKTKPCVEDELWRRVFWVLLVYEWTTSYGLGRPCCLHEEEYDVTLPIECDDEYWISDDPERAFKQPPDKPSKVTYWNCTIRLFRIIAYTSRTIFSLRKSRAQMVNGDQQWEDRVVAELDSELNRWMDTVPAHLRWNPNEPNELWLGQSASLCVGYHLVQMSVHRLFITSRRGSPHALASLIICTNAARSCVHVLEQLVQRIGTPLARNAGVVFNAGLVLLISMWGQRRSGRHAGADRDEAYIRKCVELLGYVVNQYNVASRLRDLLRNFLMMDAPRTDSQDTRVGDESERETEENTDDHAASAKQKGKGNEAAGDRPVAESTTGAVASSSSFSTASSAGSSSDTFTSETHANRDPLSMPMNWQQTLSQSQSQHPQPQAFPGVNFPPLNPSSQAWNTTTQTSTSASGTTMGSSNFPGSAQPAPSYPQPAPYPSLGLGTGAGSGFGFWDNGAFPLDLSDFSFSQGSGGQVGSGGTGPSTGMSTGPGIGMGIGMGDVDLDMGLPDCAFVDDTMTMWSTAPASFGWQDWEAYFNTMNAGGQQQ